MSFGTAFGTPYLQPKLIGGLGGGVQFLLDQYPGAAAALALFRLSSDYSGPLVRVRRSSDNAEQDIGASSNGNLDTASLLSFVGAGDGFVTVWYDQSGADVTDMTQTNATLQPRIVIAGVLQTSNGLPAIKHDDDHFLMMTGFVARPSTATIFDVLDYSGGRAFLGPTPISNVYFGNIFPTDTGTTTLQSNSGATGDYYANGELIAQNGVDSRDDLAAGLLAAASPQLISVVDGVDLSDSEYANYRTEYDLSAAVDAFPSRQLIVIYPQASVTRTDVESFIANKFGITLA